RPDALPPPARAQDRRTPALALIGARHEVPTSQSEIADSRPLLRQIARERGAIAGRIAEHADRARGRRQKAKDGMQQRGLSGAVRPKTPINSPSPMLALTLERTVLRPRVGVRFWSSIALHGACR